MFNRLLEVFTDEYRKETKYMEAERKGLGEFKLKGNSESVDMKVRRLIEKGDRYNINMVNSVYK